MIAWGAADSGATLEENEETREETMPPFTEGSPPPARRTLERPPSAAPAGRMYRRHGCFRLRDYGIPLFVVAYLFLALAKPLSQALVRPVADISNHEIFPFFAWTLFSFTPGWNKTENAVVVHSIDGEPVPGIRYVIPSGSIRHWKVLERVVGLCSHHPGECNTAARNSIAPIVRRVTGGNAVEFSIVTVDIDLRDVRKDIHALAAGEASKTDYYRPGRRIGRWTIPKEDT